MNLNNKFFNSLFSFSFGQFVPMISSIIIIPIVTRILTPDQFGLYSLYSLAISLLSMISIGWVSEGALRFYPIYIKQISNEEFYYFTLRITFLSILIFSFVYISVLLLFANTIDVRIITFTSSYFIIFSIFSVLNNFFRIQDKGIKYSILVILNTTLGPLIGVLLLIFWDKNFSSLFLGNSIILSILVIVTFRKIKPKKLSHNNKVEKILFFDFIKYGFPILLSFLLFWFLNYFSRYLLAYFSNSYSVGIFSLGSMLSDKILMGINGVFVLVGSPRAIKVFENDGVEGLKHFLTEITRYALFLIIPVFFGLNIVKHLLFNILFALEYQKAVDIILIVSLSNVFTLFSYIYSLTFNVFKKNFYITIYTLLAVIFNILFNIILIPRLNYLGAALALVFSYLLLLLFNLFGTRKFLVWDFPYKDLSVAIFSSIMMTVIVYPIQYLISNSVIALLTTILIAVVIYILLLHFFKVVNLKVVSSGIKSIIVN
ncbi:MAG: oligosaccharide flippase family protein [Ignavibacteriaceae bacterium]